MAKSNTLTQKVSEFVFTLCSPEAQEIANLQTQTENCKFIISDLEHAPTTGMSHIQGDLELHQSVRMSAVKK
jgi:hypothetical protein